MSSDVKSTTMVTASNTKVSITLVCDPNDEKKVSQLIIGQCLKFSSDDDGDFAEFHPTTGSLILSEKANKRLSATEGLFQNLDEKLMKVCKCCKKHVVRKEKPPFKFVVIKNRKWVIDQPPYELIQLLESDRRLNFLPFRSQIQGKYSEISIDVFEDIFFRGGQAELHPCCSDFWKKVSIEVQPTVGAQMPKKEHLMVTKNVVL